MLICSSYRSWCGAVLRCVCVICWSWRIVGEKLRRGLTLTVLLGLPITARGTQAQAQAQAQALNSGSSKDKIVRHLHQSVKIMELIIYFRYVAVAHSPPFLPPMVLSVSSSHPHATLIHIRLFSCITQIAFYVAFSSTHKVTCKFHVTFFTLSQPARS